MGDHVHMKRLSWRAWRPRFPWPVWPLVGHAIVGQNVVVGSMCIFRVAVGNVPRGGGLDLRLSDQDTSPRSRGELPQRAVLTTIPGPFIEEDEGCAMRQSIQMF
jgi:hypothetical protein